MMRRISCALVLMAGMGLAGCGGDDDDDSGGGAAQSCLDVCTAQQTGSCLADTLESCQSDCAQVGSAPAACRTAAGNWDTCQLAQPDICSMDVLTACSAEMTAMINDCQ